MQLVKEDIFDCLCQITLFTGVNEKLPEALLVVLSRSSRIHLKITSWSEQWSGKGRYLWPMDCSQFYHVQVGYT